MTTEAQVWREIRRQGYPRLEFPDLVPPRDGTAEPELLMVVGRQGRVGSIGSSYFARIADDPFGDDVLNPEMVSAARMRAQAWRKLGAPLAAARWDALADELLVLETDPFVAAAFAERDEPAE